MSRLSDVEVPFFEVAVALAGIVVLIGCEIVFILRHHAQFRRVLQKLRMWLRKILSSREGDAKPVEPAIQVPG
jgi:hypothetical protein